MYKSISIIKSIGNDGSFRMDKTSFEDIVKSSHSKITLQLPIEGQLHGLELQKSELFGNIFYRTYSDQQIEEKNLGTHYQGKLSGYEKSSVAVSFSELGFIGLILDGVNQYEVSQVDSDSYKIVKVDGTFDFQCGATYHPSYENDEKRQLKKDVRLSPTGEILSKGPSATTRCLNVYWEADTDIYTQLGANAAPYLTSLFNAVQLLYINDGIQIYLSELFINTGTSFYYPTTSPSLIGTYDMLLAFSQYRPTFNGDAAMLFSFTKGYGGGIAWLDQLCLSEPHAFSWILPSFLQPPSFSWSVEVATHEHGHTFGSPHTHSCSWNTNNFLPGDNPRGCTRIDSCRVECNANLSSGCTASQNNPGFGFCRETTDSFGNIIDCGACCAPNYCCGVPGLPVLGGTIMSYCHLSGGPGINFNLGFGPQPRQRIIDEINSLPLSCIECLGPPIDVTPTPTKTINATPDPTPTNTTTPTKTPTTTPTKTQTPTKTKTPFLSPDPTSTPTPTPTSCCSRFDLISSPDDTNGSSFFITNCDGSTQIITVPNNNTTQVNCVKDVTLQSGLGTFVRYTGCICSTPTPTPTFTKTPTSTSVQPCIGTGPILLYNFDVYQYDVATNTQNFLTTLPFTGSSFFETNDIANTSSKIFVKGYVGIDFDDPLAYPAIGEWSYTLNPFTISFVRFIELPDILASYPGLFAVNNSTLITSSDSDNTPNEIVNINIAGVIPIFTSIVQFPYGYRTFGDYIVTTTNKLIVIVSNFITKNILIYQYDYNNLSAGPEVTKDLGNLINLRYLFESNSNLYVLNNSSPSELYNVSLTFPYNLTLVNNLDFDFYSGASNSFLCSTVNLTPQPPTPTPTITNTLTPSCNGGLITISASATTSALGLRSYQNIVYTNLGTIFHSPYNLDGTSPGNIYAALLTTQPVWKCTSFFDGPLNRTGKWAIGGGGPLNVWVGFSSCITVAQTKTYWVGMGADNVFKMRVDGVTFIDAYDGPYDFSVCNCNTSFQYWHVYPITLSAGTHTVEMYGLNRTLSGVFGCEIYDNTFAELTAATSLSQINIVFSSSGATVADLVQNLSGQYLASGYTCPTSYTFNSCDLSCYKYIGCDTCQYCLSLHPCTLNKFFSGCCEPFDTYRIYLIPFNVANSLVDGQSYYIESIGFSGCAVYYSSLTSATFSYEYISITPQ